MYVKKRFEQSGLNYNFSLVNIILFDLFLNSMFM